MMTQLWLRVYVVLKMVNSFPGEVYRSWRMFKSRGIVRAKNRTSARSRSMFRSSFDSVKSRVQPHFARAACAEGPFVAVDPHDGGRNPEAAFAAVQQDVREGGTPVDSAGTVVARTAVADVVLGAQRAATDGRDGLQHFVPLVCRAEFG